MSARIPDLMRYPPVRLEAWSVVQALRAVRSALLRFGRIGQVLTASISVLVTVILLGLMFLTCADVVGRYFFRHPITGALEMTEILLALLIFAGLPQVTVRAEHVTIDMLDAVTSTRFQFVQRVVAGGVSALVFGFLSYRMWIRAETLQAAGETTATLSIPMYPVVYSMSILLAVSSFCALVAPFTSMTNEEERDG